MSILLFTRKLGMFKCLEAYFEALFNVLRDKYKSHYFKYSLKRIGINQYSNINNKNYIKQQQHNKNQYMFQSVFVKHKKAKKNIIGNK